MTDNKLITKDSQLRPSHFLAPDRHKLKHLEPEESNLFANVQSDYAHSLTRVLHEAHRHGAEQEKLAEALAEAISSGNQQVQDDQLAYEPYFYTKRIPNVYGERIMIKLKYLTEKIELLAVIPQLMSQLALGDVELENVLGEEITDALVQLLFIQMKWIEAQSSKQFKFLSESIDQLKRRLQFGIHTPSTAVTVNESESNNVEFKGVDEGERKMVEGDGDDAQGKRKGSHAELERTSKDRRVSKKQEYRDGEYDGVSINASESSVFEVEEEYEENGDEPRRTSAPPPSAIYLNNRSLIDNTGEVPGEFLEDEYEQETGGTHRGSKLRKSIGKGRKRSSNEGYEEDEGEFDKYYEELGEEDEIYGEWDDEDEYHPERRPISHKTSKTTSGTSLQVFVSDDESRSIVELNTDDLESEKSSKVSIPSSYSSDDEGPPGEVGYNNTIPASNREPKCGEFSVLTHIFHNPEDVYRGEFLKTAYREVLRLLLRRKQALGWIHRHMTPEASQSLKLFYAEMQVLQGLMFARLLVSPDEEIRRLNNLSQTWIREQRLINLHDTLKVEYSGLSQEKAEVMMKLNAAINNLIQQIDTVFQNAHKEINKIAAGTNKTNFVTMNAFDKELDQLEAVYQRAFQFATNLRYKVGDDETMLRKQRGKLQTELEALIMQYDNDMIMRQEIFDEVEKEETQNSDEIAKLEKQIAKLNRRHEMMKEEEKLRDLETKIKLKRKKNGKDEGKKKRKRKSKKGKGRGGKGKKGEKKGTKKGARKGGKKKKPKTKIKGVKKSKGAKKGGKKKPKLPKPKKKGTKKPKKGKKAGKKVKKGKKKVAVTVKKQV